MPYTDDHCNVYADDGTPIGHIMNYQQVKEMRDAGQVKRICINCHIEIPNMGVYIFVANAVRDRNPRFMKIGDVIYEILFCVDHGANGKNSITYGYFAMLIAGLPT